MAFAIVMKPATKMEEKNRQQIRFRLRAHICVRYLAFVFIQVHIQICGDARWRWCEWVHKTKNEIIFFFFLLLFEKKRREKYRVAASSWKYMVVSPWNLFVDDNDDALTRRMRFEPGHNGIVRDIRTHTHTRGRCRVRQIMNRCTMWIKSGGLSFMVHAIIYLFISALHCMFYRIMA